MIRILIKRSVARRRVQATVPGLILFEALVKKTKTLEVPLVLFSYYLPLTSALIDNGCQNEMWRGGDEKLMLCGTV